MKNILIVAFAIFSFVSCNTKKKNDLQSANLQGKVKSIRIIDYKATEKFGEVVKGEIVDYTSNNTLRIFNNVGNIVEYNSYFSDGGLNEKAIWKYNDKGEKIDFSVYNYDGILRFKTTYRYDKEGNQIEEKTYYDNKISSIYEYKYDGKGNNIEILSKDEKGRLNGKNLMKYDSNNNIIEVSYYNSNGYFKGKVIYKNDDNGNVIEQSSCQENNKLDKREVYTYDEKNNVIEYKKYNPNGKLEMKNTLKYKYDKKGNWTQRIEYENNKPTTITERKIEYYP